ncbi:hypothetical protein LHJ74_10305 [Streptomyces sp. N2-109]|uniref:Uncharacterized protein n=1 Tax=Streptomyces gossypii TaxID=2883101 RepID=A0ABT2JR45_9ACTN|nr:hypothetical protein [Streptomyces gossypii]MCT2590296.1 hypothetical protein [Streptomyces gossypii]
MGLHPLERLMVLGPGGGRQSLFFHAPDHEVLDERDERVSLFTVIESLYAPRRDGAFSSSRTCP